MTLLAIQVAILVGTLAWNWYSRRSHKAEQPEPAGLDQSTFPEIRDRPIPVPFGRVWVQSPQVLWRGPLRPVWNNHPGAPEEDWRETSDGGSWERRPNGWNYWIRFHLGLCHGPIDSILGVKLDREVISQDPDPGTFVTPLVITSTEIRLTATSAYIFGTAGLFGDSEQIGTEIRFPYMTGKLRIYDGADDQVFDDGGPVQTAMQGSAPALPGFRGIVTLTTESEGGEWGMHLGVEPRLRPLEFQVERIATGADGATQWYDAKAEVVDGAEFVGMNPVHIVRELLTSKDFGLAESTSRIDSTSFEAAADTLYSEKVGLNMLWERESSVREFLDEVLKVAGGILWFDPSAEKWKLKLIREDYTVGATPLLDESDIVAVEDFSRPAWHDLPNQVTVSYRDPATWEDRQTAAHNQAAQQAQGGRVVATTVRYAGVTYETLANTLASRDLRQSGKPLARVTLRCLDSQAVRSPGDVIRWSWSDYGVTQLVLRVLSVDIGDGRNNVVTLRCVEDAFGAAASLFSLPPETYATDPNPAPVAASERYVFPAPYWLARRSLGSAADTQYGSDATSGWLGHLAERPQENARGYQLQVSTDGGSSYAESISFAPFARRLTLDGDVARSADELVVLEEVTSETLPVGTLLLVRGSDETYDELVVVSAVDAGTKTLTVTRGVLDTTPQVLDDGAEIWGPQVSTVVPTVRTGTATLKTKALTVTLRSVLDIDDATADTSPEVSSRYGRPYPPRALELADDEDPLVDLGEGPVPSTEAYPDELMLGAIYARWAGRGRTGSEAVAADVPVAVEGTVRYRVLVVHVDFLLTDIHDSGSAWGDNSTTPSYTIPASAFSSLDHGDVVQVLVQAIRSDDAGSTQVVAWQWLIAQFTLWKNLFAQNVRDGGESGAITGVSDIAGSTVTASTEQAHRGSYSFKVVCSADEEGLETDAVAAATGAQHSAHVWLRVASGTMDVYVQLDNATTPASGTPEYVTLTTDWQRVEVLSPASVNVSDNLVLRVYSLEAGTFYADTFGLRLAA